MFCPAFGKSGTFRGREIHNTWIISFCTVNSSCAKSHYQAQHTVGSIDRIIPFISTVRVADTCSIWHEKIFVHRSGYTLDQKRHLFIFESKSALPAVFQSGSIHSAGIYGADRIFQFRKPLVHGTGVDAEDGFVFSGKCITERIFLKTAGTDDDRTLSKVFQHTDELKPYGFRERTGKKGLFQLRSQFEVSLFCLLMDMKTPEFVMYNISIEYIGTKIIGIVRFHMGKCFGVIFLNDLSCEKHTACLAADTAGADHAFIYKKIIIRFKIGL